ncbi:LysR family transcriptional regulator [Mycobacterium sp. 3519A]|uniref:LysR family transcriptional regulator n=1 Tax=Mycobacterium sp. 3519A TaxID=2057184 RepID=UPI000C7DF3E9|nr:LysR family transcriptional regulator [Mycobacterium sp. 3519A]
MELRELAALVTVVEEGGISAAARRLHVSQPALSQTVTALERELGVQLFVRSTSGVQPTEAGLLLAQEARAVLARRDQAVRALSEFSTSTAGVIRIGVPREIDFDFLTESLTAFSVGLPETQLVPRRLSSAAQIDALLGGRLDIGLVRELPKQADVDAVLVAQENLGALLAADIAAERVGPDGVRLERLRGLKWVAFPRGDSPAWFDELTATLRSHGIDIGLPAHDELELIAAIKFAAVAANRAFALAPVHLAARLPPSVVFSPLVGNPVVRRTWVIWHGRTRRRDIGQLIATFEASRHASDPR